jgi:Major tropism determinant N-terminal domain
MTLYRMLQRRGTASQWSTANTVLGVGEIGFDVTNNVVKIGDGLTAWNSLQSLDGKSAYEIAVSNGFVGTESEWLISIAGLPNPAGNAGKFLTTNGVAASWSTIDLSAKQDKVVDVSDTEIGYLNGVTSLIQDQLDSKQNKVSNVSDTEIGYLDGVTSTIQTQLNAKAPSASPTFTGSVVGAPSEPDTDANAAKNIGYVGLPQVALSSGNLTLNKSHAGKHVYVTGAGQTITIPANSTAPFEIGTNVVVINSNVTSSIAIAGDTLRLAGGSATGTRSLAAYGIATLIKVAATTWIASGNGLT